MEFKSQVLIHPGLGNSGPQHWQSVWEMRFPQFKRIHQSDWETPDRLSWTKTLDEAVMRSDPTSVIIVAHSLACCTVAYWAAEYDRKIKGALLVAPSDTESAIYPKGTSGFTPMPLNPLPFRSIIVASANDLYVSIERASKFAKAWDGELVNIGNAGHINAESRLGFWEFGLELLARLDK